jgi:hypothetical protein
MVMVLSIQRKLMKGLLPLKIPKIFTLLNTIIVEHECDLIIDA